MVDAFSTPSKRFKTMIFLTVACLSAIGSAVIGIDDNPPGILLALLAAIALVLALTHPWQTTKKYLFLLLGSVLGFVLFTILNIFTDSIVDDPAASSALKTFIQSPTSDTLNVIISMICTGAFLVGVVGSIVMAVRSRITKN